MPCSWQVEQLLTANDTLGCESAARSERIAELEEAMSRLYYQLRSVTGSCPAGSVRASCVRASGTLSGVLRGTSILHTNNQISEICSGEPWVFCVQPVT